MKRVTASALLVASALLSGCPAPETDPAPPPRKPEVVTAPPRALGALAAGTDAAPRPEAGVPNGELMPGLPGPGEPGGLAPPATGGQPSLAPAPEGAPPSAPPEAPDAGMAL
jgi:hypothetical protein